MPKLSPDFSAFEVTRSISNPDLALPWEDLPAQHAANLQRLVDCFLQPVRDRVGRLRILSGYRPDALNAVLPGASPRSRHRFGLSVDFIPDRVDQVALFKLLAQGQIAGASWDRLTLYTSRDIPNFHVDLRPWEQGPQRGRLYTAQPWQQVTVEDVLALAA
jgi:hypothetical protein